MITIREVAKKCGFSQSTVSLVFNSKSPLAKYIPEETKAVVRKAAKELGYVPNSFARSLRARYSRTIGIIVFDITDPYCAQILRGIENGLDDADFTYVLSDTQNDSARFRKSIDMLLQHRIEGLLLVANTLSMNPSMIQQSCPGRMPIVSIGRDLSSICASSTVRVDNEKGAYLSFQHLHELGHRKIAFLRGPMDVIDSEQRWHGIKKFAYENRLTIPEGLVVELSGADSGWVAGRAAVNALLRRGEKFTAVLAFDDMSATGAIRALASEGLRVPRDCSVIGFDDIDAASFYNPPLTTIRQPMSDMGARGAKSIIRAVKALRTNRKHKYVLETVQPELVLRESTSKPK